MKRKRKKTTPEQRRAERERRAELDRRLLAAMERTQTGSPEERQQRRKVWELMTRKRWAEMTRDERRIVRAWRTDLDRRLHDAIERHRDPGQRRPAEGP
jgi:hypothetical protein